MCVYEAVRVTIQNRLCMVDVMKVSDDVPASVSQIPLEILDLVVDPQGRRLIGNLKHNGERIRQLYSFARPILLHQRSHRCESPGVEWMTFRSRRWQYTPFQHLEPDAV